MIQHFTSVNSSARWCPPTGPQSSAFGPPPGPNGVFPKEQIKVRLKFVFITQHDHLLCPERGDGGRNRAGVSAVFEPAVREEHSDP